MDIFNRRHWCKHWTTSSSTWNLPWGIVFVFHYSRLTASKILGAAKNNHPHQSNKTTLESIGKRLTKTYINIGVLTLPTLHNFQTQELWVIQSGSTTGSVGECPKSYLSFQWRKTTWGHYSLWIDMGRWCSTNFRNIYKVVPQFVSLLAKSVNITPISLGFMVDILN